MDSKNLSYDCTLRLELEIIANKKSQEEVEKIMKTLADPSEPKKRIGRKRRYEDMEIYQEE